MDDTMAMLGEILAARDQQRFDHATAFLDTLTAEERDLVHRGAIYGYVTGWTFGAANPDIFSDAPYPHDDDILTAAAATMRHQPIDPAQLRRDSPRRYWLFREATVMGHVLGARVGWVDARAGRPLTPPAPESAAVFVVEHCQSTSDLYPILGDNPSKLAWRILRGRAEPLPRATLAAAVAYFLPHVTADQVDGIVEDYLDDERLVETPDGVMVGDQS